MPNRKKKNNEFYVYSCSLTRGQREVLKENDKCHERGENAINNMEMTPRDYLRRGWNSHHNSVAAAPRAAPAHVGGT